LDEERLNKDLELQGIDYFASMVKSLVGAAPFVGSLLSEISSNVIPNQRIERIVDFAKKLESNIEDLDKKFIRAQSSNPDFTDLLEEGVRLSTRAVSEERRKYISSILSNSLNKQRIKYAESKYLLRILGDLNDVEIILLRYFSFPYLGGDEDFREKHENIIQPPRLTTNAPDEVIDKNTLYESYKNHLSELGLLRKQYEIDRGTNMPKLDTHKKTFKVTGYSITKQGKLLLREIDLLPEEAY
jgi:hypothetical protein